MKRFGIDISAWQKDFDIAGAKKEYGVEFVIIKCGGADAGYYKDKYFERNYEVCEQIGMPKGVYYFSHALDMERAKSEVQQLLAIIKEKKFEYPIFMDYEGGVLKLTKRELTDIAKYQLKAIQDAGWWAGIYTSQSHFKDHFFDNELSGFSHWVANYSAKETPKLPGLSATQMWQCCGGKSAIVNPVMFGQNVDQNFCYIDYPEKIKAKGINGYKKQATVKEVYYTVRKGDTLSIIARKQGVSLNKLVELNKIPNPNVIYVGQKLRIK